MKIAFSGGIIEFHDMGHFISVDINDEHFTIVVDHQRKILVIESDKFSCGYDGMGGAFFGGGYEAHTTPEEGKVVTSNKYSTFPKLFNSSVRDKVTKNEHVEKELKSIIKAFCERWEIGYKDFGSLDLELKYLTLPLARDIGKPPAHKQHGLISDDDPFLDSFDRLVKKTFGTSTPKLRRLIAEKAFGIDYSYGHMDEDTFIPKETIFRAIDLGYSGSLDSFFKPIETFTIDDSFCSFAKVLVKAFGIDKAYNILSSDINYYCAPDNYNNVLTLFIEDMGYEYIRRMLQNEKIDSSFTDAMWMWDRYREGKIPQKLLDKGFEPLRIPRKCKTFKEIHDRLVKPYSEMKAIDEFQILQFAKLKKHRPLKKLNKSVYNGYTIVFPENTRDFVNWGREMSNCISSYFDRVQRDETMVFSLVKDGKICFNIECRYVGVWDGKAVITTDQHQDAMNTGKPKFKIQQFMAYHNTAQSIGDRIKLEKFINTMV